MDDIVIFSKLLQLQEKLQHLKLVFDEFKNMRNKNILRYKESY